VKKTVALAPQCDCGSPKAPNHAFAGPPGTVAASTNGLYVQWIVVVTMIVVNSRRATVYTVDVPSQFG